MPNKPRPSCPKCDRKMAPLFLKRPRGTSYMRADNTFMCTDDGTMARGRGGRAKFLR